MLNFGPIQPNNNQSVQKSTSERYPLLSGQEGFIWLEDLFCVYLSFLSFKQGPH